MQQGQQMGPLLLIQTLDFTSLVGQNTHVCTRTRAHTFTHTHNTQQAMPERGAVSQTQTLIGYMAPIWKQSVAAFLLFFFFKVGTKFCSRIGDGGQPALGHVDYKSWCSFPSSLRWPLRIQTPNWTLGFSHFPIFSWPDLCYDLAGLMALPAPRLQKPEATMTSPGITATP